MENRGIRARKRVRDEHCKEGVTKENRQWMITFNRASKTMLVLPQFFAFSDDRNDR